MNEKLKKVDGYEIEIEGIPCFLDVRQYANGRPAIRVMTMDNDPHGVLTVNIPTADIGYDEIIVKTWSENIPMAAIILHTTGLFEDTGKRIPTGFMEAEVWKIL